LAAKTITLRADLVERLERLARAQGRTLDDVFGDLLDQYAPPTGNNWALALAEGMEEADIDWQNEPLASEHSREHFDQHAFRKWQRAQNADERNDD
jgi:predicted transcriptional regulator